MSGAWTPGPWVAAYLDNNSQRVVMGEHIEICTCWHHSVGSIEKEMEANAILIAAAPDLYAALDLALSHLDENARWHRDAQSSAGRVNRAFAAVDAARAALAKARGEA